MSIKKLQNNYTTPEQSKRLLELGVPAWTADCYFYEEDGVANDSTPQIVSYGEIWTDESKEALFSSWEDIPCWSVGRLIEIWEICGNGGRCTTVKKGQSRIESLVKLYEENALYADFSKLEE